MSRLRNNSIVRTALLRPISMLMGLMCVLVLGTVALLKIPIEMVPSGAVSPRLQVDVDLDDSTPQDMEEKITRPLEDELASLPNLQQMDAHSVADESEIDLTFSEGTDMDAAYRDVRDRISRVRSQLPEEVREIKIRKRDEEGSQVAFYRIVWPEELGDVQDRIKKKILRRIERIPGVAMLDAWGERQREIRIEIDRSLAEAANLNLVDVVQQLSSAHFVMGSGEIREADGRYLLRSMANFRTAEEIESIVIGPNELRLRDIATVVYDFPEKDWHARYKGSRSMGMEIMKESQANTVEVCDAIEAEFAAIAQDPTMADFSFDAVFLASRMIRVALGQVLDSGSQGGILAFFILIFFLRRLRLTIVLAASIPLSMFAALPAMYFSGQFIDLVSLIGLMICIGLVVDNSVVVAENIARYRSRGVSLRVAALHGASEVALPITMATATTMIVFMPLALMSAGKMKVYLVSIVTPVCVSVAASLLVSLVLIPLAVVYLLDSKDLDGTEAAQNQSGWRRRLSSLDNWWKNLLDRAYEQTLGRLRELYRRILFLSLHRPADVLLICGLTFGSLFYPGGPADTVHFVADQDMGDRRIRVRYRIPNNVSLEEVDAWFRDLEEWFDEHRHEWGGEGEFIFLREGRAFMSLMFEEAQPGEESYMERGKKLVKRLPEPAGWKKYSEFSRSGGGQKGLFPVMIFGNDHKTVRDVHDELEIQLLKIDGVAGIAHWGGDDNNLKEMVLRLEPALAERLGVSADRVGMTVANAIRGRQLPRLHKNEKEIEVSIRYKKEHREELNQLLQFRVPTAAGSSAPIQVVTSQRVEKGTPYLGRYNKRVAAGIRLELDPDPEKREEIVKRIRRYLDNYELPSGISFDADRNAREADNEAKETFTAMILATAFIFLLMGFLFESVILPLSVLPAIPLSLVGVWWMLSFSDGVIDRLAGIGLLLLLGIVVNNGIVLVDFINNARAQGVPRFEAIVQAGVQRFRPILMTAMTTVGGMIPLAFSPRPAEGISYVSFGRTLVGGMTAATILTLIVVPVCYLAFDNLRIAIGRFVARRMQG